VIYKTSNWHIPATVDLKDSVCSLILQSADYFAVADGFAGLQVSCLLDPSLSLSLFFSFIHSLA
jgi:hypothetical protein